MHECQQVGVNFKPTSVFREPRLSEEALSEVESAGQGVSTLETATLVQSPCAGEGHGKRGLCPTSSALENPPCKASKRLLLKSLHPGRDRLSGGTGH